MLDKELISILKDVNFIKNVKEVFFLEEKEKIEDKIKTDEKFRNQLNLFFLNYKVKEARRIFRRLVELFKEHDFLTTQGYVDQEDESMIYDEAKDGNLLMTDEDEA